MPSRIEDYALIGDCHTGALVGRDGSIDWLCWPRFDSEACFAALLGKPEHGRWLIAPQSRAVRVTRRYRERTLILETDFETAHGAVTVIDFMPVRESTCHLVRIVVGRRGRVPIRMELVLRFNYGASVPWVSRLPDGALRAIAGPDMVLLRTSAPLKGEGFTTVSHFTVGAGETIPFVLSYGSSYSPIEPPGDVTEMLEHTESFWQKWADRCSYSGEWSDAVTRSLITLKALTYAPTGGIVAAPTTSLPERLGGVRNWDYRICWLRDATIVLLALMHAEYLEEADAWRRWLQRAVAGSPDQAQIMYGLAGERRLDEWIVKWLPGYAGSHPVRIGNAAAGQFQLDIYGEVIDALHQARKGGLESDAVTWAIQSAMLEHLASVWNKPDQGIWEVESHGLGRDRSRHPDRRAIPPQGPGKSLASAAQAHPRRGLPQELQHAAEQLCSKLRFARARREPVADSRHRIPAAGGSAGARNARSHRAASHRRRIGASLSQQPRGRRPAAWRRFFPRLQFLARRQLRHAGQAR